MLSYPIEMQKYLITGEKPIVIKKEAPEEFKELARKQNKALEKFGCEPHWKIEGE